MGIVGQNNVATVVDVQSFGANGGGDDGLGGGHGLVDFQTRAAADTQGHDDHGRVAEMLDDGGHAAGYFDRFVARIRGPLLNTAVGIASDDAESRLRDFGLDGGPDFTAKVFDGIDVGLPVHGADEGDEGRGSSERMGIGILIERRGIGAILR